jgi:toxin ParE1/3/4
MSRVEFSRQAEEDLAAISEYIARDNPAAAYTLVDKIEAKCQQLVDIPDLGQLRPDIASGQYRSTMVGSYVIYYSADGGKVWIVRVLHGARDHGSIL